MDDLPDNLIRFSPSPPPSALITRPRTPKTPSRSCPPQAPTATGTSESPPDADDHLSSDPMDGIELTSSPIRGSPNTKKRIRKERNIAKGQLKRQETLRRSKAERLHRLLGRNSTVTTPTQASRRREGTTGGNGAQDTILSNEPFGRGDAEPYQLPGPFGQLFPLVGPSAGGLLAPQTADDSEGIHVQSGQPAVAHGAVVIAGNPTIRHADGTLNRDVLNGALGDLAQRGLTWGDLVEFMSDPRYGQADLRWRGFFINPRRVSQVLSHWTSWRNSRTGRETVSGWALEYINKTISSEGNRATDSGILQARKRTVDESFVLGFDLAELYEKLKALCPTMVSILHAFSTTARQKREQTSRTIRRKEEVSTQCSGSV